MIRESKKSWSRNADDRKGSEAPQMRRDGDRRQNEEHFDELRSQEAMKKANDNSI